MAALDLARGFALYTVWLEDAVTADRLADRLREAFGATGFRAIRTDRAEEPFLAWLLSQAQPSSPLEVLLFDGWHRAHAHAFTLLNEHRNLWIEQVACRHLFFLQAEARQWIRRHSADLYSVRSGDFYFVPSPAEEPLPIESWTLAGWASTLAPGEYLRQTKVFATDSSPSGRDLWARAALQAVDGLRLRGRLTEASALLTEAQQRDEGLGPAARAEFLLRRGLLAHREGRLDQAQQEFREAEGLFGQVSDERGLANTALCLGDLAWQLGELEEAGAHYRAAEPRFRTGRDDLGLANTIRRLGDLAQSLGALSEAAEHYHRAEAHAREAGDRLGLANTRQRLGDLARRRGDLDKAQDHYRRAASLYRAVGDRPGAAAADRCLDSLTSTTRRRKRGPRALAPRRATGA